MPTIQTKNSDEGWWHKHVTLEMARFWISIILLAVLCGLTSKLIYSTQDQTNAQKATTRVACQRYIIDHPGAPIPKECR